MRGQSSVSTDPATNGGRIGLVHDFGRFGLGLKPATSVDQAGGMESQYGPARHADTLARHGAKHQGAGRKARPVYHHAVTRLAQVVEHINELTDFSAPTAEK